MATVERKAEFVPLELPEEFEDLEGLLRSDLQAIIGMFAQRAHDRLFLTRREFRELQAELWNGMTEAIRTAVAPLSVENR